MEKFEKLIVIEGNNGEILGIVTLSQDGATKLGFGASNDENKELFNTLMNKLMKIHPEGLEELISKKDAKGIVKVLSEKGYYIRTKENIITKINVNNDEGHFEVVYADEQVKKVKKTDFAKDEDYVKAYEEYIDKLKKNYKIKNTGNYHLIQTIGEKDKADEYDSDDDFDFVDDDDKKKKGIKNLKISKKLIAIVTAGAILLVGKGISKLGKKEEGPMPNPTPTVTQEVDEDTLTTAIPTAVPTVKPTAISLDDDFYSQDYQVSYMTDEERLLEPTPYPIQAVDTIDSPELWAYIYPEYEETVNVGDVDIDSLNIEKLYEVSYNNMWDLSNYVFNGASNKNLETTPMRIHFEKIIQGLSAVDKAYIKYFNDLRNEIVYQGFDLSNSEAVKKCNHYAVYELVRCVINDNPLRLNVNGRQVLVRYSELGYEAQEAISNICWGNYLLMGTDTIEFNGELYNQDRLAYEVWDLTPEASPKF